MKKIIFLLAAMFGCLQISRAAIDLSDIVGTLDNSWKHAHRSGESFSVSFRGAKQLNYPELAQQQLTKIRQRIQAEGASSWLTVESISTCTDKTAMATFSGTIWFRASAFTGTGDRNAYLAANNGTTFRIVQSGPKQVLSSASSIHPNDRYTVTVKNACFGVQYSLYNYSTLIQSATATSSDVVFRNISEEGNLVVRDDRGQEMQNRVSISYYWPFHYSFPSPTSVTGIPADKNGGVVKLKLYTSYGPTLSELQSLCNRYNAGESWNNQAMRIFAVNQEVLNNGMNYFFYVNVYCAPNVSSSEIRNETGFRFSNLSWDGVIRQPGGGGLTECQISYRTEPFSGITVLLNNIQPMVAYELSNNGRYIAVKLQETDAEMAFYGQGPGIYTVRSMYKNISKIHNSVCKIQLDKFIQQEPLITFGDADSIVLDKNGGTQILSCTRNRHIDDAIIKQIIQEFNTANSGLKMQFVSSTETGCDIQMTWGPNLSTNQTVTDSKFIFSERTRIKFIQPKGGSIIAYDMDFGIDPSPFITLKGSQIGVLYEVCKDNQSIGIIVAGTGESISFRTMPKGAVYTIRGRDLTGSWSINMNGVAILTEHPEDYFTPGANAISTKTFYEDEKSMVDITYYNGIGDPYQTVHHQAAKNARNNVVTPILYDEMYRADAKVLLPFPVSQYGGARVDSLERDHAAYYVRLTLGEKDSAAYTRNVYDKSGLNRIRYSYRPGEIYRQKDKFTEYLYGTNTDTGDEVFAFIYDYVNASIRVSGLVASETLIKNTMIDEDGQKTEQFTDNEGRLVLERKYTTAPQTANTYYIYDPNFMHLRWILPPEASRSLFVGQIIRWSDPLANQYCYRYLYDGRGNVIERQLPGCEKEAFVYDNSDRLRLSRDGNLRSRSQWLYNYYDNHGNLLITNLLFCNMSREALQDRYNRESPGDLQSTFDVPMNIPFSDITATVAKQLGSYIFGTTQTINDPQTGLTEVAWTTPNDMAFAEDADYPQPPLPKPTGLKTHEKLTVLADTEAEKTEYVERTYFYDYKNRPIQVVERNPKGGISRVFNAYDNMGNILRSKEVRRLVSTATADILIRNCSYDNRRRLIGETWTLNDGQPAVIQYTYDDLGKLIGKTYPNASTNISMKYNIQGWLTGLESACFSMNLAYHAPYFDTTNPSYTGNITEWAWQNGSESDRNTYAFTYDALSRLTDTRQYINEARDDRFVEKNLSYDRNGNIQTLHRVENGQPKNTLSYSYIGNQLTRLYDNGPSFSYTYDLVGNRTHDGWRNLSLSYNNLNRIEKVMRGDSIVAKYSYLWDSTKLSATDSLGNGLVYAGSLVYRKADGQMALESAGFSDGRIVAVHTDSLRMIPHYHITDHLGSVRAVVDANGEVLEHNYYHPFGSRWNVADAIVCDNRHRYNGKEEQAFVGVPYIDYGARMYDPESGIWHGVDQLSEQTPQISPYAFCGNNPIRHIDTDGRKIVDANGILLYKKGAWNEAAKGSDAMRVGNAMMKTDIGQNTWDEMAAANYPITIAVHSRTGPKRELGRTDRDLDEFSGEILNAQINIFEGSIEEQVESGYSSDRAKRLRSLSAEDRIGVLGVHEGVHSVDKTPVTDDKSPDSPREKNAIAAETTHTRELKQQERKKPIVYGNPFPDWRYYFSY